VRDFGPANDRIGSDSVIRRCRLNVRFARKRTRLDRTTNHRHQPRPGAPAAPLGTHLDACRSWQR
jgi:hypothetical protein